MTTFPSTLIIGDNYQNLLESLGHSTVQNPDLFIVDENSGYKIEIIRQINNFLQQLPYNHQNKVVLIKNIDLLEIAAQNALLKNLEEPGNNNFFILTTKNQSLILATIISRCHIIRSEYTKTIINQNNLPIPTDIKSALNISSTIDKSLIKETLLNELNYQQQNLIKNPSTKISHNINHLLKSLEYIDSNLDPRLALDYYLLKSI